MSWLKLGLKLVAAGGILSTVIFATEAAPRTGEQDEALQLVRMGGGGGRGGGFGGGGFRGSGGFRGGGGYRGGSAYRGGNYYIRSQGYRGYRGGCRGGPYACNRNVYRGGAYGSRNAYRYGNRPAQLPAYGKRYNNRYAARYPRYAYRRHGYNNYYNGYWYSYPWWLGAAAVGTAVASSYGGGNEEWCASRYRTYDPASNTYVGRGGRRYQCLGPN
jgi:hypothetical protein